MNLPIVDIMDSMGKIYDYGDEEEQLTRTINRMRSKHTATALMESRGISWNQGVNWDQDEDQDEDNAGGSSQ